VAERVDVLEVDRVDVPDVVVYAMVLGADSIDDCDVLRAGRTGRLLGGGFRRRRRWGRFCGRLRSGMSASSTRCWAGLLSGHGRPARALATPGSSSMSTAASARSAAA
jgi:hypothetical protein